MAETEARTILGQANQSREEGKFLKALQLTDEALLAFEKLGDLSGVAETEANRLLIFRHLYQDTDNQIFLIMARFSAEAGVAIAKNSQDLKALAIPYFNLAKAYEDEGNWKDAVENYQLAVDHITHHAPDAYNRPGVIADFQAHLATALYKSGDKTGRKKLEEAISELEQSGEEKISDYNFHVWLSGAHMNMAWILLSDDPAVAKTHLTEAKKIIDSDSRLGLRLRQWEKLAQKFTP